MTHNNCKFKEENPTYWKDYYQNKTKNNKYFCVECSVQVCRSHKARHNKTQKHLNNVIEFKTDKEIYLMSQGITD